MRKFYILVRETNKNGEFGMWRDLFEFFYDTYKEAENEIYYCIKQLQGLKNDENFECEYKIAECEIEE